MITQPSTRGSAFCDDFYSTSNVTTGVTHLSLLTQLLKSGGLMSTSPQHGTPIYTGNNSAGYRSRIRVSFIELKMTIVGAQASFLGVGDLFNNMRIAVYLSDPSYSDTINGYLISLNGGSNINEVNKVYLDKTYSLPTQAWDNNNSINVPQVINAYYHIPVNHTFNIFSVTASGTGAWDTQRFNLYLDAISDSGTTPHPTLSYNARVFFEFLSR